MHFSCLTPLLLLLIYYTKRVILKPMDAKNISKKALLSLDGWLFNTIVLVTSFLLAFVSSKLIHFKAKDTFSTSNAFTATGFHPEINFIKVVLIIFFALLYFLALLYIRNRSSKVFRIIFVSLISIAILTTAIVPSFTKYYGHIDTFHHGEQLSPALSHIQGKKLFTEIFFLHGAGEDVLTPGIAIKYSHKGYGIGTYYFFTAILQFISAVLFLLLIAIIIKPLGWYCFASSWFLISFYSAFYYVRDVFVWTSLILLYYLFIKNIKSKPRTYAIVAFCSVASISLFYAVDRGILLLLLMLLVLAINVFTVRTKNGHDYKLTAFNRPNLVHSTFGLASFIIVQLFAALFVGLTQYKEFIRISFIDIPKYGGLLFNFPLPLINTSTYLTWLPVFVGVVVGLMIFYLLCTEFKDNRTFKGPTIFGLIMYIFAILFLRTGLGRPDWGHIAYSTPTLFLTAFYVSYLYVYNFYRLDIKKLWLPIVFFVFLFIPYSTINKDSALSFGNIGKDSVKQLIHLRRAPDNAWLPPDVKTASQYIKSNTTPNDYIFVFTQQPIYYYLTERKNPSRFYISWFADPQKYTTELLNSLKQHPPKMIVYSSGSGWDNPDGFTSSQRLPEVNAWIEKNYTIKVDVGPVLILRK